LLLKDDKDETVKVPELVNVCILYPPLVVIVPPVAERGGAGTVPLPSPTLVQTLEPAVASVRIYCSPDVELTHK
jgi:hypothetical protein